MAPSRSNPTGGRSYDASGRRRDARARRQRIIEVAAQRFVADGYGATSVDDIAAASGVATPTVYAAFGSKAGLLKHAVDVAVVGDDEQVGLVEREVFQRTVTDAPVGERIRWTVSLAWDVHARSAPLLRVVDSVAGADPAVAELQADLRRQMRETNERFVASIPARALRPGVRREDVGTLLDLLAGPATWSRLVSDAGWSRRRYERWLREVIMSTLLIDDAG